MQMIEFHTNPQMFTVKVQKYDLVGGVILGT